VRGEGLGRFAPTPSGNELTSGDASAHTPESLRESLLAHLQDGLRTPINAIIGYSGMLMEDCQGHPYLADVRRIHSAGTQLLERIDRILDTGRNRQVEVLVADLVDSDLRDDLNAHLTVIIAHASVLMQDLDEDTPPELHSDVGRVLRAARQLMETLAELSAMLAAEGTEKLLDGLPSTALIARDAVHSLHTLVAERTEPAAPPARILVVDDDDANRELVCRQLGREGYRVGSAPDGEQAMHTLHEERYDLVLLDLIMPNMNGYELLAALKRDDQLAHVPVVVMSALEDVESITHCMEIGADEYLPKLFNPVLLRTKVAACLERKRLRDRERLYLETIRSEQEKSERLLLNILPRPVAQRLKRGESKIADHFPEVTVLFSDLVNFTDFASNAPADVVVDRLNEVFQSFDVLAERYGLEKIKSVGDAYMLAGGLPLPRSDHAAAVANTALEMLTTLERLNARYSQPFAVRIGIHTGPVVAGVIGRTRFTYDLWGDTVNVASRMESLGEPGAIHVSEITCRYLEGEFLLEPRAPIVVKGKGSMATYFVRGKRQA